MSYSKIKTSIWKIIEQTSLLSKLTKGENIAIKGLYGSLKPLFLSLLMEHMHRSILIVLPDLERAESMVEDLTSMTGEEIVGYYPGGYEDKESPLIINTRKAGLQMRALRDLLKDPLKLVVTTADGFSQKVPSRDLMNQEAIHIEAGKSFDLYELIEKLVEFGYTRESLVERPGEVCLRGGLLDIFPYTGEAPHRIDFFGDLVESVRIFDIGTQRSRDMGKSLHLIPAPPMWDERSCPLFHFFEEGSLLFLEDPELIKAQAEKEYLKGESFLMNSEELEILYTSVQIASHHTMASPKNVINVGCKPLPSFGRTVDEIRENMVSFCDTGHKIFFFCESKDQKERMQDFLGLDEEPIKGLSLTTGPIREGFHLLQIHEMIVTDWDIFKRRSRKHRRRAFSEGIPIRELTSLNPGDFVVHIDYGIGKYQGLEMISVKAFKRECLAILYADSDKLYVPVDKMDRVQKYSSRDGAQPTLYKLGSAKWDRVKNKTKQSIKDIAKDLIDLYSARQALPGYTFSSDTTWQRDLESSFEFEETPDQEKAIEAVRFDMEKPHPMDRLICGDVGYGKTEVAVRAAFKSVADGKQVAVLVPTTILAQQHFRTFYNRLSSFPIQIEMLSRFRNRQQQKKIIEDLKNGRVDIVIGTHRLLSKDVEFKDIGLVIIDEEQRFGVRHKERLKTFRTTVDVLTLTATPIPRTLHLSLMGIRDMSLINTPPKDRIPIFTEVIPFDESVVSEAIVKELERGGQVFFVHNRVRSIYAVARMIRRIVPGIRLAVAHGQMEEKDLERVMMDFIEGKFDCLVSTMIIGSGMDMPRVNTLIVHRADRLGLSQLYQLRGRVGRSDRRAFAYLMTPPFHSLTQKAIKRLRTIEEFTELGSGFQIALRDLEIRGTGNLLGVQQSGFIDAVGFDLYTRLVNEAVQEMRQQEEHKDQDVTLETKCLVDIDKAAYFPESYVSDESQRIDFYRRLSSVETQKEIDDISDEMLDRYGKLPEEALALIEIACLRVIGQKKGLKRILLKDKDLFVDFDDQWVDHFSSTELFSKYIRSIIDSCPAPIRFLQEKTLGLRVSLPKGDALPFTKKWLQSWD